MQSHAGIGETPKELFMDTATKTEGNKRKPLGEKPPLKWNRSGPYGFEFNWLNNEITEQTRMPSPRELRPQI
jgi:hypothetical protein